MTSFWQRRTCRWVCNYGARPSRSEWTSQSRCDSCTKQKPLQPCVKITYQIPKNGSEMIHPLCHWRPLKILMTLSRQEHFNFLWTSWNDISSVNAEQQVVWSGEIYLVVLKKSWLKWEGVILLPPDSLATDFLLFLGDFFYFLNLQRWWVRLGVSRGKIFKSFRF